MFDKILIANRGEIACRIIRACHKLGIGTVAIYSKADQGAVHVELADEAFFVGEAEPEDSYLHIENILEAARESGAQAIHPGYGFLSENPTFARRCQEAGISFVGPNPGVMEKMGDKIRARKLAKKAGLPVLPGMEETIDSPNAEDLAWKLGLPLMVKPAEGGGGIGIHVIESMDDLVPLMARTRLMAERSFGSPRLYFERYLKDASHIEVQLVGDEHGNLVHLYERDCSVQRRNQKLVEETPATKLTPRLRRRACNLALKLGRYIGYTNAGTVEFLVSGDGQIYFLEMNTRLQVEHGITELVTGLDLVELQIRVAAGETLPLDQQDVNPKGHAIEARVYPEDPDSLMPQAGTVTGLHLPSGEHIRLDTALRTGYTVALQYEPLLGKVMAWGESREDAVNGLLRALSSFRLEGVTCNIPLLREVLDSEEFARVTYHTGSLPEWLERRQKHQDHLPSIEAIGSNGREIGDRELAAAIGVALALAKNGSKTPSKPSSEQNPWRLQGRRDQLLSRAMGSRGWR